MSAQQKTHVPTTSCCICIQAFVHTPATASFEKQGRTYQACSFHAPVLEQSPTLADALRMVKKHNKNRGAV